MVRHLIRSASIRLEHGPVGLKKGRSALLGWASRPILRQKSILTLRVTHGMNATNTYFETQTQTANPGELVVMLYKGAARFLASAIEAVDAKNHEASHNNLLRAQAVITELTETLDLKKGGELAKNLGRI